MERKIKPTYPGNAQNEIDRRKQIQDLQLKIMKLSVEIKHNQRLAIISLIFSIFSLLHTVLSKVWL